MFVSAQRRRVACGMGGAILLVVMACADGDRTTTYDYPPDPQNVTRTGPPDTTVTVAPNDPDLGPPGDDVSPQDSPDLDAVGGAGGFGGSTGLGGSGGLPGVGGGVPLGGAGPIDISGDDESDGLGGSGVGGSGVGGTGTSGSAGSF